MRHLGFAATWAYPSVALRMQHIRTLVSTDFETVNRMIVDQLHSRVGLVEDIGHYLIDAGGKRLRPLLALLSARACQYQGEQHIEWAVIIEFIHTATLLHDDVVDLSTLRRGRPTANANWGNASSVLVGDFIYSRAFQMLARMGNSEVISLLADSTNQIAEGEVLQLIRAGNPDTGEEDYLQVIRDKTAVLFAAAMKGSALIAHADTGVQEALYQYGIELGIAFQIADDALDYEGDAATMGKNVGDDLAEGKPTLPLIHAIQHAKKDEAELIRAAIRNKNGQHLDQILEIIRRSGSLDYTWKTAEAHAERARNHIEAIAPSPYRDALGELAGFSVHRRN